MKISASALAMRSLFHFPSELPKKSESPTQHARLIAANEPISSTNIRKEEDGTMTSLFLSSIEALPSSSSFLLSSRIHCRTHQLNRWSLR
jgi:hypothetical protein